MVIKVAFWFWYTFAGTALEKPVQTLLCSYNFPLGLCSHRIMQYRSKLFPTFLVYLNRMLLHISAIVC